MAGFCRGMLKRKNAEEASDDFSDFSISPPARKSRRLDAELLPSMGQVDAASTMALDQQLLVSAPSKDPPEYLSNNERAIVLYKPVETPITLSPGLTNVSLSINCDLLHCLKNHALKQGNQIFDGKDEDTEVDSDALAVVPWVPSRSSVPTSEFQTFELLRESMEAEEDESASMEVEEMTEQATPNVVGCGEGFQQWPQNCMPPQFLPSPQVLPNTSTPIMWSW